MALKELNVDDLVSMDLEEAKKLIFSRGWRLRVVREDGKDYVNQQVTDTRTDRVLLTVACKIVTDAKVG